MSINTNEMLYLIQGIQFRDPKLYDALTKMINGLSEINNAAVIKESDRIDAIVRGLSTKVPWIPIDASGAGLAFTYNFPSYYIKSGSRIDVVGDLTFPVTANVAQAKIGGLPFIAGNAIQFAFDAGFSTYGGALHCVVAPSTTTFVMFDAATTAVIANNNMSLKILRFEFFYFVDE